MSVVQIIGLTAAVLSAVTFLPQVIKTWRSRSAADISLLMFSIATVSVVLWLTYGILIGDVPVILANSITLLLSLIMLVLKLKYGKK
jgi:MtN3 and saliva related transmembrane protein